MHQTSHASVLFCTYCSPSWEYPVQHLLMSTKSAEPWTVLENLCWHCVPPLSNLSQDEIPALSLGPTNIPLSSYYTILWSLYFPSPSQVVSYLKAGIKQVLQTLYEWIKLNSYALIIADYFFQLYIHFEHYFKFCNERFSDVGISSINWIGDKELTNSTGWRVIYPFSTQSNKPLWIQLSIKEKDKICIEPI